MAAPTLKSLHNPRSGGMAVIAALREHLAPGICIIDTAGKTLLGDPADGNRIPIQHENATLGYVVGSAPQTSAVASLLTHLAARETESRALASEVLHLYREIHLIEELSEQLAPLLNVDAVAHSTLEQAQKLITATHGSIMVQERAGSPLSTTTTFGELNGIGSGEVNTLGPSSRLAVSILERGNGEIVI